MRVKPRKSSAAVWFAIHGWLGLPIWAFMFFICLTGSIATVSEEITWLVDPAARAVRPSADARPLSYDDILARVEAQQPDAVVSIILLPTKNIYAWQLSADRPGANFITLYVNPYTGSIQGVKEAFDLRQFLRALHAWLLIPFTNKHSIGWYIVSALSIPLLGSLITGLFVYKKFWRGLLRPRLRVNAGARIFWGDLHRLAGLWSIPFILIMSVTAFWFLIQAALEDTGRRLPGEPQKPLEHPHVARRFVPVGPARDAVPRIGVDEAVRIASARFHNFTPAFISLPGSAYDPIEVSGRSAYPLVFETAYLNPYNGRVLATRGIYTSSTAKIVADSLRPLHTGDFAGLWLKLVYFAFGLILTAMSLSGMLIWLRRTTKANDHMASALTGTANKKMERKTPAAWWLRWRFHLSAVMVIIPAWLFLPYLEFERAFVAGEPTDLRSANIKIGRWPMQLQEVSTIEPAWNSTEYKYSKELWLVPCAQCLPEIRALYISFNRPGSTEYGQQFGGSYYRPSAHLLIRKNASADSAMVWITAEGWDGSRAQLPLPLAQASPIASEWLARRRR